MNKNIIPLETIEHKIYMIRGKKVMIDKDLAFLYGVETRTLNQAVKRNGERFPDDFMFQLTKDEAKSLRSQIVILKGNSLISQIVTSKRGGARKLPYVFTEQGVAMLSSVLNSKKAIQVNIQIIRTFTRLREMIISNKELSKRLAELEKKYDEKFRVVFQTIAKMIKSDNNIKSAEEAKPRKIGFEPKSAKFIKSVKPIKSIKPKVHIVFV